ncbi:hypothetical protein Cantr_00539 [Candida viswanathii]|uniref:Maf-like protein C3G6.03c n=1 Tax=Candida viswanathii TaxID=5486 RepID=A0A367YGC5_9ASCO|nr:hypothetical protein Cantr_00539 [Candida viswanathii]
MLFNHPLIAKLNNFKCILGSQSPRRKEILENNLGIRNFTPRPSSFEEDLEKDDKTPLQYVQLTSQHKAEAIIKEGVDTPAIVLTCDTIISCNGKVFEKPMTKEKQREDFKYFSQHPELDVISALTVIRVGDSTEVFTDHATTKLKFKGDVDITDAYIESEEGLEVAGGFKYQGLGCLLFESMEGDSFNVVGLPVKVFDLLEKAVV